jgi:EpsI family protein
VRKLLATNFLLTVALLGGTLLVCQWTSRSRPGELAQPLTTIAQEINGWTLHGSPELEPSVLRRLVPTSYLSRAYDKGNERLGLFIAYYAQQRAGESMHSPKHCLPGSGWEIWKHEPATLALGGRKVDINKYYIQKAGERMLVFYWYQSRDRVIANEYLGKILLIRDTMRDGNTAGAIVRISVADRPELAADALGFSARVLEQLQSCFRGESPQLIPLARH